MYWYIYVYIYISIYKGSVLAQMAFPLHAPEISDKSDTGREKYISVPAESSHFFPFKFFSYRRGQFVTFFGKDEKCHKPKKIFSCARASHSSQKCDKCNARASHSSQKCDKCNACVCCFVLLNQYGGIVMYGPGAWHFLSPNEVTNVKSLTQIWDGNLGRNSAKTDPVDNVFPTSWICPYLAVGDSIPPSRLPTGSKNDKLSNLWYDKYEFN